MSAEPRRRDPDARMSVDEFLTWAEERPGRYELAAGTVVAMSPERVRHAEVKFAVQAALMGAIRRSALPCRMLPDGMSVRIDRDTAYEPDALVYSGQRLDPDAVEVPDPLVLVEVLSPSTRGIDSGLKLAGYFSLPSVRHYLVVDPERRLVVHHRRDEAGAIATRILAEGALILDPPGLELTLTELFENL